MTIKITNHPHVVVLGGGACGMSAALELGRLGARATVLEREERVGGLCGTHEQEGFRFDFGGHRFITRNPAIDALVKDLLGGELLDRTRSSIILNGGKRYRYPLELDDVLRQYGAVKGARAVGSYLAELARGRLSARADRSFRDWVTHRFGADLYRAFFGPYTAKLWGIAPEEISADWAAERISTPSLADVLLRLLHAPRPRARTHARSYRYPRLGIGQIFESCAARITEQGGGIAIGAEVTGLLHQHNRLRAVRYRDAAGEHELECDAVISTIALPTVVRMLGALGTALEASARRLRFRAIRLLNVMLDGPPVSPHTWMYVSEPRYLMSRIQEPLHRSPSMAPAGSTSLMLEIPCDVGDPTWRASDDELYERCLQDLTELGLPGLRARTKGRFSSYVREGYPIYHLDYQADRRALLGHLGNYQGIVTCGRQGSFRYVFMDTAMEMGIAAARAVVEGRASAHLPDAPVATELYEGKALTA